MVVEGSNVNFDAEGNYLGMLDANTIVLMIDQLIREGGLKPARYIWPQLPECTAALSNGAVLRENPGKSVGQAGNHGCPDSQNHIDAGKHAALDLAELGAVVDVGEGRGRHRHADELAQRRPALVDAEH